MIARLMPAALLTIATLMLTLVHRPAAADDLLGDLVSRPLSVAFLGPADGPYGLSIDLNTGDVIAEAPNQAEHQQWVITPLSGGQYRLSNAILGEDFALTAQGRDRPLLMTPADGSAAQLWSFRLNGEGYELMTGDGALGLLYDPAHLSAPILVNAGECCNGFQSWDLDGQAGAFAAAREARQTSDDGLLPEAWSQPTDLTPEFFFADDVVELLVDQGADRQAGEARGDAGGEGVDGGGQHTGAGAQQDDACGHHAIIAGGGDDRKNDGPEGNRFLGHAIGGPAKGKQHHQYRYQVLLAPAKALDHRADPGIQGARAHRHRQHWLRASSGRCRRPSRQPLDYAAGRGA